jgi:cyclic pyranopterin monophosphate synthase
MASRVLPAQLCWVASVLNVSAPPARRAGSSTPGDVEALNRELAEVFGTVDVPEGSCIAPRGAFDGQSDPLPAASSMGCSSSAEQQQQIARTVQDLQSQMAEMSMALARLASTAGDLPQPAGMQQSAGPIPAWGGRRTGLATKQTSPQSQQQQQQPQLTHVDGTGRASMVDVSGKQPTTRTASASCIVSLGRTAYDLVAANALAKGDVLTLAQAAGIQAAKATPSLIPLCHSVALSRVTVELATLPADAAVKISATATCVGPTGVEMEALTATAVAALTLYDMAKAVSKDITIGALRLDAKAGGRSGEWKRSGP